MFLPPISRDPFDAVVRKVRDDRETKLFVKDSCADPAKFLEWVGSKLVEIIRKSDESRALLGELWRRYLLDCKRHGVEPLKRSART